jgi:hypothetical protein
MSENPVLKLARHFFGAGEEVPVKDQRIYTRDDLVRAIVGQQWAVAIALHDAIAWSSDWQGGLRVKMAGAISRRVASLPCAVDVVEGMEQP